MQKNARLRCLCLTTVAPTLLFLNIGLLRAQAPAREAPPAGAATATAAAFFASAYLPLGHWAYDYIDVLLARGRLGSLQPLIQPYRRMDVAHAVRAARESGALLAEERPWAEAIAQELAFEMRLLEGAGAQELRFERRLGAGVKALSHKHRDALRPEGGAALFPTLDLDLIGEAPAVATGFRIRWDNHYLNDPQFPGGLAIAPRECDPIIGRCAYRVEDGYVEVQFPYVRLFFGRTYRNWGLPGTAGFLVSNYAYSYDHVAYRFGSDRVALTGFLTFLNDFKADTTRYFSSHRFDWQIRENLTLGLSESVVYGGVNRPFDFNLANPVGVWEISPSGNQETNALGLLEVWWRPRPGLVTYGAFLLDNTMVGEEGMAEGLTQYGAALGVQLPAAAPRLSLRADFSLLNSLAYRSRIHRLFYYTVESLGLGRDVADAITGSLQADWFLDTRLVLKPRLALQFRGEDDIREPWPADAFSGHDLLLVGQVETTLRPSLSGTWRVPRGELNWDAGLNFIHAEDHRRGGGWGVKGVARVQAAWRTRF